MSEQLNKELEAIMAKESEIQKQVQTYQRKLMEPLWTERRELVKSIPNFWTDAISHSPMFNISPNEHDVEALENLEDFHVEYDKDRPEYRKVVAHFKKNDLFKNESLTKEFTVDEENGAVISKSTINYHSGKEPNNKRKADEEDDDFDFGFLRWFGDESIPTGVVLTEEVFPAAIDYYRGDDDDEDDDDEIELGSDSEEDEEEEEAPKKKAKK